MDSHVKELRASTKAPTELTGDEAGQQITSSSNESYSVVGFNEAEATRLGFKAGDSESVVSITVSTYTSFSTSHRQ